MKTIVVNSYRSHEFKQRLGATHAAVNNDNDPAGGATPVVLPVPATHEETMATAEQLHRPWLIQGMRNAL